MHKLLCVIYCHLGFHLCDFSLSTQALKLIIRSSIVKFVLYNELLILYIIMWIYNLVSKLEHSGKSLKRHYILKFSGLLKSFMSFISAKRTT